MLERKLDQIDGAEVELIHLIIIFPRLFVPISRFFVFPASHQTFEQCSSVRWMCVYFLTLVFEQSLYNRHDCSFFMIPSGTRAAIADCRRFFLQVE